jgi:hypothetical protein
MRALLFNGEVICNRYYQTEDASEAMKMFYQAAKSGIVFDDWPNQDRGKLEIVFFPFECAFRDVYLLSKDRKTMKIRRYASDGYLNYLKMFGSENN